MTTSQIQKPFTLRIILSFRLNLQSDLFLVIELPIAVFDRCREFTRQVSL